MTGCENVGVFVWEKFWLEPELFPYKIVQHFSNPVILHTYFLIKMEQTECSETSAYKIQMPGNYPEESIKGFQYSLLKISHFVSVFLGVVIILSVSVLVW